MRLSKVLVTIGLLALSSLSHFNAVAAEPAPFSMSSFETADGVTNLLGISPLSQLVPQSNLMPDSYELLDPSYTLTSNPPFKIRLDRSVLYLEYEGISFPKSNWRVFTFKNNLYRWRKALSLAGSHSTIIYSNLGRVISYESSRPLTYELKLDWDILRENISFLSYTTNDLELQKFNGYRGVWENTNYPFRFLVSTEKPVITNLKISWKGAIWKDFGPHGLIDKGTELLTVNGKVSVKQAASLTLIDTDYATNPKKLSTIYFSKNGTQEWAWNNLVIRRGMSQDTLNVLKPRWRQ